MIYAHKKYILAVGVLGLLGIVFLGYSVGWQQLFSRNFVRYLIERPFVVVFQESRLAEFYVRHSTFVTPASFRQLSLLDQQLVFERIASTRGAFRAKTFLLKVYPHQPSYLHEMGHSIGEAMFREYGDEALGKCDAAFSYSCYHGAIVQFMLVRGLDKKVIQDFAYRGCTTKTASLDRHGCYHGFGHALMIVDTGDMMRSLQDCDALVEDPVFMFDCYQGVAMEHAQANFLDPSVILYQKQGDPGYPCGLLDKKYQPACYSEHVVVADKMFSHDWPRVVAYCASLSLLTEKEKQPCFFRLGVVADAILGGRADEVMAVCHLAGDSGVFCVRSFVQQRLSAGDIDAVRVACVFLPKDEQEACFADLSVEH